MFGDNEFSFVVGLMMRCNIYTGRELHAVVNRYV